MDGLNRPSRHAGAEPGLPSWSESPGVLDLLGETRSRQRKPRDVTPEDRRRCVQHLGAEGLSVPEIAKVLGTSERTVARDRRAVRESEALTPDPKLAGVMAGRLLTEADACVSRIRRVTRDPEAPHAVRVDGERAAFEILDKAAQRLQTLGFLPSAAQRLDAALTHHFGDTPSLETIGAEAERLKQIEAHAADWTEAENERRPGAAPSIEGGVG